MSKPNILSITNSHDLLNWYWSKAELVSLAKKLTVPYSGGKFEIQDRIIHFFDTGEILKPKRTKPTSTFDWSKEPLSVDTRITDSYRNGPHARAFFEKHIGPSFSFNADFMSWMKENIGKTLQDAIEYYKFREDQIKSGKYKQSIPDYNQFNLYTRDYFTYKPDGSMNEVRKLWDNKINLPGNNTIRFEKEDFKLLSL